LTFELIVGKTIPPVSLLGHGQFHQHDPIGERTTAPDVITLVHGDGTGMESLPVRSDLHARRLGRLGIR